MFVPVTRTLPDLFKLEPVDGTNYKRWTQKLLIFFEQMDMDYVLFQNLPETPAEASVLAITPADTSSIGMTKSKDEAKQNMIETIKQRAKDIWTTLETRYGGDDTGRKKFVMGKWLQFQMIDEKPMMDQIYEYENLVADVLSEGFTKYKSFKAPDAEKDNEIIAVIVVEAYLVENKEDWILNTGSSRHFCSNKALFHELLETTNSECVFMGNSTTVGVLDKGKILIKLTYDKILALIDVLYVSSLRRNLVSGSLLNKAGLKIVLESDKVIITKHNNFVGKRYLSDGLFVLNTVPAMFNKNSSSSTYLIKSTDV
ncbi:UNVERIFIED_CONTAM: hypothetical protein Sangu_0158900 [Sesamum angustifolium]|uniref:Retrovirus-related Pol polyprotein from transposon TNT 1-94-like beta-barrel domain-containing protein n=1 Tax=Sesamum angustifolium TaxID=2727405 RepID=A0AAW2RLB9_9LAMI